MKENTGPVSGINEDPGNPPTFIITESSGMLLKSIESILAELINRIDLSPSNDEFYNIFLNLFDLYDRFQKEVIAASGINIVCGAGCAQCCCHWVEDVNSFEGAIISRYLIDNHPEIISSVITSFREDAEVLDSLCDLLDEKVLEFTSGSEEIPDQYELLLSCFYQLERPCALLDEKGHCVIYPVRPFTCRDYLNVRDTAACLPDRINDENYATLIMYLSDTVSQQLEILHNRFDDGSDDMSLRSLLVRCLE